jgi:hypothetical protein
MIFGELLASVAEQKGRQVTGLAVLDARAPDAFGLAAVAAGGGQVGEDVLRSTVCPSLPRSVKRRAGHGHIVDGHPALVAEECVRPRDGLRHSVRRHRAIPAKENVQIAGRLFGHCHHS